MLQFIPLAFFRLCDDQDIDQEQAEIYNIRARQASRHLHHYRVYDEIQAPDAVVDRKDDSIDLWIIQYSKDRCREGQRHIRTSSQGKSHDKYGDVYKRQPVRCQEIKEYPQCKDTAVYHAGFFCPKLRVDVADRVTSYDSYQSRHRHRRYGDSVG